MPLFSAKKFKLLNYLLILILFLSFSFIYIQASPDPGIVKLISYQGKLLDGAGDAVANGNYKMVFKIYEGGTGSGSNCGGGAMAWSETYDGAQKVSTTNGIFRVSLGSINALNFNFTENTYWLSLTIGDDSEMDPCLRITAVPQAINADLLDGIDSTGVAVLNRANTFTGNNIFQYSSTSTAFGIYNLGAGASFTVADEAGDATPFIIDPAGNIGIGTNSPASLLTIGSAGQFQINSSGQVIAGAWQGTAISVSKGGTGLTAYTPNQLLYASDTGTISQIATSSLGFLTTNVAEGSNLYYTDVRARAALSSTATGLAYASGTGVFFLTSGYLIPFSASTTEWAAAYGWGDWSGQGYITASTSDALINKTGNISMWTNDANYITSAGAPVQSVAGRTGAVTLAQADISGLTTASSPSFAGLTLTGNLAFGANTFTTSNTTVVANLNADLLDGQHGSYYAPAFTSGTANYFWATPNGSAGVPSLRAIAAADIPTLNQNTTGSAATLTTARTIAGVSFNGSADIAIPSTGLSDTANIARLNAANSFSLINPLTTIAESWIGPSSTTGIYFKGGNVGIGTTSPGAKLETLGSGAGTNFILNPLSSIIISDDRNYAPDVGGGIMFGGKYNSAGSRTSFAGIRGVKISATDGNYNGRLEFFVRNNGDNDWTGDQRMVITNTGYIGIGTIDPVYPFDLENSSSHATASLHSTASSDTYSSSLLLTDRAADDTESTGGMYYKAYATLANSFLGLSADNANYHLVILEGGNVGIGTTSPGYPLQVGNYGYISNDNTNEYALFGAKTAGGGGTRLQVAADTIRFGNTFASPGMILSSGNVGIGTTSPTVPLDVVGYIRSYSNSSNPSVVLTSGASGSFPLIQFIDGRSGGNNWNIEDGRDLGILGFYLSGGGGTKMAINSSGNVGIGTTGPGEKLEVNGNILASTTGATLIKLAGQGSIGWQVQDYTDGNQYQDFSGNMYFRAGISGTGGVTPMSILSTGNVGIGTPAPSTKLDVSGSQRIYDQTAVTGVSTLSIRAGAGQATSPLLALQYDTSNYQNFTVGSDGSMSIARNGGAATFTLSANDRVGIGTTNPLENLHITTGNVHGIRLENTVGSSIIDFYTLSTPSTARNWRIAPNYSAWGNFEILNSTAAGGAPGTNVFTINSSGNVGIGTTGPGARLSVSGAGAQTILDSISATDARMEFKRAGVRQGYINWDSGKIELAGDSTASAYLGFLTGGSERVRITSTGNVGIGTTSPGYKLDVYESASAPAVIKLHNANNTEGLAISSDNNGSTQLLAYGTFNFRPNRGNTLGLYINTSGYVGIGTTTPTNKLTIHGTGSLGGLNGFGGATTVTEGIFSTDAEALNMGPSLGFGSANKFSGATNPYLYAVIRGAKESATVTNDYAGYLAFYTQGAGSDTNERMRITSTGNVGIGTTGPNGLLVVGNMPTNVSSVGTLQIYQANAAGVGPQLFLNNAGGNINEAAQITFSGGGTDRAYIRQVLNTGNAQGELTFWTGSYDRVNLTGGLTEKMRVTAGGNVGIGTTGPLNSLDVEGYYGGQTTGTGGIRISDSGTYDTVMSFKYNTPSGTDAFKINRYDKSTNNNEFNMLTILHTGNVGIGTTNPGAQLDLSTDSARKLTTNTWTTGSDIRIKTDVQTIDDALEIIRQIRPVSFHYNSDFLSQHSGLKDGTYYNFIAQEYQQIFPDSVTEIDGLLYLNSSNMIPYAIAAIKALDEKISSQVSVASNQIASSFEGILEWLSDKIMTVKKLFVKEELCIGNTCVNEEQLKALLEKNQIMPSESPAPEPQPEPEPEAEAEETAQ